MFGDFVIKKKNNTQTKQGDANKWHRNHLNSRKSDHVEHVL